MLRALDSTGGIRLTLYSNGLVNSFMLFQLLPRYVNIHRVMWSNLARVIKERPAPFPPILEVVREVFLGNEVDLPQVVADLRIVPGELGREPQEVLASVRNYRALTELEVDVGVFGPPAPRCGYDCAPRAVRREQIQRQVKEKEEAKLIAGNGVSGRSGSSKVKDEKERKSEEGRGE